jgi:hypothetical protein
MNAKNTLIIAVMGETPYAEMVGDVNVPYCQDSGTFGGDGCLWFPGVYSPPIQPKTLEVAFDNFEKDVVSRIR